MASSRYTHTCAEIKTRDLKRERDGRGAFESSFLDTTIKMFRDFHPVSFRKMAA